MMAECFLVQPWLLVSSLASRCPAPLWVSGTGSPYLTELFLPTHTICFITQIRFTIVSMQQRTQRNQLTLCLCERSADGQEGAHHFLSPMDLNWRLESLGLWREWSGALVGPAAHWAPASSIFSCAPPVSELLRCLIQLWVGGGFPGGGGGPDPFTGFSNRSLGGQVWHRGGGGRSHFEGGSWFRILPRTKLFSWKQRPAETDTTELGPHPAGASPWVGPLWGCGGR